MNKYVFDIDGTICSQEQDYGNAKPFIERINIINKLFNEGHIIIFNTARGSETGIDWRNVTECQLDNWGVKYHKLYFGKPAGDYYIDDRSVDMEEFFKNVSNSRYRNQSQW